MVYNNIHKNNNNNYNNKIINNFNYNNNNNIYKDKNLRNKYKFIMINHNK